MRPKMSTIKRPWCQLAASCRDCGLESSVIYSSCVAIAFKESLYQPCPNAPSQFLCLLLQNFPLLLEPCPLPSSLLPILAFFLHLRLFSVDIIPNKCYQCCIGSTETDQTNSCEQNPQVLNFVQINGFLFLMVVGESHSLTGQTEAQNIKS